MHRRSMLHSPIAGRLVLALLLLFAVTSCSMAGLAYGFAPRMAVRYADEYLDLDSRQEAEAMRLFQERLDQHSRDELPQYHAFLGEAESAAENGVDEQELERLLDRARELYRLAVRRTIPVVARILAGARPDQVDTLAQRLATKAESDREEADEDHRGRTVDEIMEDVEEWVGPLTEPQRELVLRKLEAMKVTRPFWLEWQIASNERLVALLRNDPAQAEIETFLNDYWIERRNMPRYLEEALAANGRQYREMVLALDELLSPEQRHKARDRFAEFRGMVVDMMPREVRVAVLEGEGGGHAQARQ